MQYQASSFSPSLCHKHTPAFPLSPQSSPAHIIPKTLDISKDIKMEQSNHFFTNVNPQIPDVDIKYLIDPSTISSDEFRMYAYKIIQCPRIRNHEWTSCPLAHNGERAKRRDLRHRYYAAIPCSKYKTGDCRKGDLCEFAHGIFEFWLHPAKYRTRKCHAGEFCRRSVCFFAHTDDQLRPETTYRWYKLNDPLNPGYTERYTIGYECSGRIMLPFVNSGSTSTSQAASTSGTTNYANAADNVADRLALLNIGQSGTKTLMESSSPSWYSNNLNDLPPELKWILELVKDT